MGSSPLGVRWRRGSTTLLSRVGPEVCSDPRLYHKPRCPWIEHLVTHSTLRQATHHSPATVGEMAAGLGRSPVMKTRRRSGGKRYPAAHPLNGLTGNQDLC